MAVDVALCAAGSTLAAIPSGAFRRAKRLQDLAHELVCPNMLSSTRILSTLTNSQFVWRLGPPPPTLLWSPRDRALPTPQWPFSLHWLGRLVKGADFHRITRGCIELPR